LNTFNSVSINLEVPILITIGG